jgi:hypothetical protein
MKKNKQIDRIKTFYDDESFNLDVEYGMHYYETDTNFKVVLYKVDAINTRSHSLYGETKASKKTFLPPVELTVMMNVEDSSQMFQSNGGIAREDVENISFSIYEKELKRKKVDIIRGDYIVYQHDTDVRQVYEVVNANNVNYGHSQTMAGYKPYFRNILAKPVKEDTTLLKFD